MDINIAERGKVTVISLVGDIDASQAETVGHMLDAEVKAGKTRLVADMGQVGFISSAGMRALVQALKDTTRRGGDFRLANIGPRVQRALDVTGLNSLFKVFSDVETAVASFAA